MAGLKDISIFSTLSDSDFKEIEGYLVQTDYRKRDTIFSEGDPPDWLCIVRKGKVKITKVSVDGKEIILEVISPNELFGAVAVLRGFPYPANAVAMEDSTVTMVSRSNFMKMLDRFPSIMYCMMQSISDRMKGTHETMKNIALEKVSSRIAALLLKLGEKKGVETPEGTVIDFSFTKQDIADMVGTTVETAIRTMSQFKKLELIEERTGHIIIKDAEQLKKKFGY